MKYSSWPVFILLVLLLVIDPVVHKAQNGSLFPIRENGKWGLMNDSGQVVIPAVYSTAVPLNRDLIEIGSPGGKGVLSRNGKEILPPHFAEIKLVNDTVLWYRQGTRWGYLHPASGNSLPPIYREPYYSISNAAVLTTDGDCPGPHCGKILYTMISYDAQVLIPPQEFRINLQMTLNWHSHFSLRQAILQDEEDRLGFWHIPSGKSLPPAYASLRELSDLRFAVTTGKDEPLQLIDLDGDRLSERRFQKLNGRKFGWIEFQDSTGKGFISPQNNTLSLDEWEDLNLVGPAHIAFKKDGSWGLFGADEEVILEPVFGDLVTLGPTVAARQNDRWGVFSLNGDTILPVVYREVGLMSGGAGFRVLTEEGWAWLRADGSQTPISGMSSIGNFENGLALLQKDSLLGMFNQFGEVVVPLVFTDLEIAGNRVRARGRGQVKVFHFDEEGRRLAGNRFILVRSDNYGNGNPAIPGFAALGWFLHSRSGKYGLRDPNTDSLLISPRYERVRPVPGTDLTVVERQLPGKVLYGLVNHVRGKQVMAPVLPEIRDEDYSQANWARVITSIGRRTMLSREGRIIESHRLRFVGKFSGGIARVMLDGKLKWETRKDPGYLDVREVRDSWDRHWEYLYAYQGKWGFVDGNSHWICKAEYEFVSDIENGLALVMKDNKWGMVDSTMKTIVPLEWDYLSRLSDAPGSPLIGGRESRSLLSGGEIGYVALDGSILTGPDGKDTGFEYGRPFSEGLAAVQLNKKWGYIDKRGRLVIAPMYDDAGDFHEGRARVRSGRQLMFVDRDGHATVLKNTTRAGDFHEGLVWAHSQGKGGYLDSSGNWVIEPRFTDTGDFRHGLAPVRTPSGYGMIDRRGNMVVKPRYQKILPFEQGMAIVVNRGKYGCIDSLGREVVSPRYRKIGPFREGRAQVQAGSWRGFIDQKGDVVVKGKFRDLADFSGGLAAVKVRDRWGYVNRQGQMVIEPQYIIARDFGRGPGLAMNKGKWHLLDTAGNELTEPITNCRDLDHFRDGMALGRGLRGAWLYLDSLGNCHRSLRGKQFDEALPFSDGTARVRVDGGWCLIDRSMQPLMSRNFRAPFIFEDGMAVVRFGMKYGLIGADGQILHEAKYDHLEKTHSVIQAGIGSRIGYMRPDGSWVREPLE